MSLWVALGAILFIVLALLFGPDPAARLVDDDGGASAALAAPQARKGGAGSSVDVDAAEAAPGGGAATARRSVRVVPSDDVSVRVQPVDNTLMGTFGPNEKCLHA